MHRQIGADAVAGAMRIIDAVGPQILPCENVELAAARPLGEARGRKRSEEHTSELQSLMRISYAVFCLKKKIYSNHTQITPFNSTNHKVALGQTTKHHIA